MRVAFDAHAQQAAVDLNGDPLDDPLFLEGVSRFSAFVKMSN
jgi:hypothetical protein